MSRQEFAAIQARVLLDVLIAYLIGYPVSLLILPLIH